MVKLGLVDGDRQKAIRLAELVLSGKIDLVEGVVQLGNAVRFLAEPNEVGVFDLFNVIESDIEDIKKNHDNYWDDPQKEIETYVCVRMKEKIIYGCREVIRVLQGDLLPPSNNV